MDLDHVEGDLLGYTGERAYSHFTRRVPGAVNSFRHHAEPTVAEIGGQIDLVGVVVFDIVAVNLGDPGRIG